MFLMDSSMYSFGKYLQYLHQKGILSFLVERSPSLAELSMKIYTFLIYFDTNIGREKYFSVFTFSIGARFSGQC